MIRTLPIVVLGVAALLASGSGSFAQRVKDRAAGLALEDQASTFRTKALAERTKNPAQAKLDMAKAQVDISKGLALVAKSKKER